MAKAKTKGQGVVLGLSEIEAYAAMSAIRQLLKLKVILILKLPDSENLPKSCTSEV